MAKVNLKDLCGKVKLFWKEPGKGRYLNLKEVLCLGSTSLGIAFIYNIITMYVTIGQLPLLYNMGDSGTLHATIMYIIASLGGLVLTPLYGKLVQRTNTKIGRYKPYLLLLAPVVALFGALSVWSPQGLSTNSTIAYVYCLCVPTLLVSNIWYNTWNLFPGVITPNQQERVDIWAPIGLIMGFAPSLMNMLKDVFAGLWGDIVAARIFGVTSAVVGLVLVIAILRVKERVFVSKVESEDNKIGVGKGLKMVFKNKPLMILMIALVLGCMRTSVDNMWHIIARVKYADNMADGAKIFGALSLIVSFAMTPNMILMPLFTRKMNNRTIMIMWLAINTVAYVVLGIVGFQNIPTGTTAAAVITALRFVASFNAINSLIPIMLTETADYQQYLTKYRLDGFVQTMGYSVPLVFSQLLSLVPALIQKEMHFNPADYQIIKDADNVLSEALINNANNYANILVWISAVSGALMLIALLFYTLSKKKHAEITEALKAESVNTDQISEDEGHLTLIDKIETLVNGQDAPIEYENADGFAEGDAPDVTEAEPFEVESETETTDEEPETLSEEDVEEENTVEIEEISDESDETVEYETPLQVEDEDVIDELTTDTESVDDID